MSTESADANDVDSDRYVHSRDQYDTGRVLSPAYVARGDYAGQAQILLNGGFWTELGYTLTGLHITDHPAMSRNAGRLLGWRAEMFRSTTCPQYPLTYEVSGLVLHQLAQHLCALPNGPVLIEYIRNVFELLMAARGDNPSVPAPAQEQQESLTNACQELLDEIPDALEMVQREMQAQQQLERLVALGSPVHSAIPLDPGEDIGADPFAPTPTEIGFAREIWQHAAPTGRTSNSAGPTSGDLSERLSERLARLTREARRASSPPPVQYVAPEPPSVTYEEFRQRVFDKAQQITIARQQPDAPWRREAGGALLCVHGPIRAHVAQLAAEFAVAPGAVAHPLPVAPPVPHGQGNARSISVGVVTTRTPARVDMMQLHISCASVVIPVMSDNKTFELVANDVLSALGYGVCQALVTRGNRYDGWSSNKDSRRTSFRASLRASLLSLNSVLGTLRQDVVNGSPQVLQKLRQAAYEFTTTGRSVGWADMQILVPITLCDFSFEVAAAAKLFRAIEQWAPLRIFLEACPCLIGVLGTSDE